MYLFDAHAHLHDSAYDKDREDIINNLQKENISVITIGTDYEESKQAVHLSNNFKNIYASIGVHPVDNKKAQFDKIEFQKLLSSKVVAVGECGLDYFKLEGSQDEIDKEKERQRNLFIQQIEFARENNLPLMLHSRPSKGSQDAYLDILNILKNYTLTGNVHFFVGSIEIAKKFLDLGFTFSIGGVITITREYDEMLKFLPLENILLETDSPYVAPIPYRGKRNSPENVKIVLEKLAEIKNIEKEELAKITTENIKILFRI